MTENELIKTHIEECEERIGRILGYMETAEDANTKFCERNVEVLKSVVIALEELQQYRAIGTIEEFKALKEKATPKKPIDRTVCKDGIITFGDVGTCPNCGHIVAEDMFVCEDCFQVLDWEGGE